MKDREVGFDAVITVREDVDAGFSLDSLGIKDAVEIGPQIYRATITHLQAEKLKGHPDIEDIMQDFELGSH